MASLGNPVMSCAGTIRRVRDEVIPAREAGTLDNGRRVDAREGYTLRHFSLDTGLAGYSDDAGVADVTLRLGAGIEGAESIGQGEVVNLLVRPYLSWADASGSRPMRVMRFALVSVVPAVERSLATV